MNRHDGIHGILLGSQHHFQFDIPNGGCKPVQLVFYLFLGTIILIFGGDLAEHCQIGKAIFLPLPVPDYIIQAALFLKSLARLVRFIPEISPKSLFIQFQDPQFLFRDVKDTLLCVRFFFSDQAVCLVFLQTCFFLLCVVEIVMVTRAMTHR
ncbi:MAG: hypothetical protein ACD_75C01894G0001 [uncultured bacterium]|nr:MAG: hypothetical protein ACD_75C01894G0001 [uncultured bacterium]